MKSCKILLYNGEWWCLTFWVLCPCIEWDFLNPRWDGGGNTFVGIVPDGEMSSFLMRPDSAYWWTIVAQCTQVWCSRGDRHAACCLQSVRSFHGGNIMVWPGISDTGKTPLIILDGNLNAHRYVHEILIPLAIAFITNMGGNTGLQDDNARPHWARIVREFMVQQQIQTMIRQPALQTSTLFSIPGIS